MRLLVCGGRDFSDKNALWIVLDQIHAATPIAVIIHGAAAGADTMAGEWAVARGVPVEPYRVEAEDWKLYGGRAGNRRNQLMLDEGKPDLVLATPGGSGTRDMKARARKAGVKVDTWVYLDRLTLGGKV